MLVATYTPVILVEVAMVVALISVTTHQLPEVVAVVKTKTVLPEVPEVVVADTPVTTALIKVEEVV